jgi:excisionase family DNA binding protein
MDDRLIGTKELAAYLGVPMATLHQWAHHGKGPRYFRVGRHRKYDMADVKRWLEEHAVDRPSVPA